MSKIALSGNPSGTATYTIASPAGSTDRTLTLPDATGTVVTTDATQTLTNKSISADQINSGTLATARLGSGTANNTTFLRGDQTWQTISTTPTTDQVLTATAGASVGAVGTYAFLAISSSNTTNYTEGDTLSGSSLRYQGVNGQDSTDVTSSLRFGGTPSGTWRLMGSIQKNGATRNGTSVWLRIS